MKEFQGCFGFPTRYMLTAHVRGGGISCALHPPHPQPPPPPPPPLEICQAGLWLENIILVTTVCSAVQTVCFLKNTSPAGFCKVVKTEGSIHKMGTSENSNKTEPKLDRNSYRGKEQKQNNNG